MIPPVCIIAGTVSRERKRERERRTDPRSEGGVGDISRTPRAIGAVVKY